MFVDEWLIEAKQGVSLVMTPPIKKEVVLVLDQAWEGPISGYYSVMQDEGKIRLYYRGYCPSDASELQVQDEMGCPLPEYTLADMVTLYGDELDGVVQWEDGNDISALQGRPVKMRFVLRDANLYALHTGVASE